MENLSTPALPYLHTARLTNMAKLLFSLTACFSLEDEDEEENKAGVEEKDKKARK